MPSLKQMILDPEARPSRNKNFGLYEGEEGRKLLFSFHLLTSLSDDIERAGLSNCRVGRESDAFSINITDPALAYRRQARLSREEYEVLRERFPLLPVA